MVGGMNKQRKILLFGGSFSPPTLAHEAIIAQCLRLPQFDELWIMPSGDRPDKTIAMSDQDRLRMLELVKSTSFAGDSRLQVTDFELRLPRPTATYITWQALSAAFPDVQFWFVFGMDAYQSMPSWPHGKTLRENLPMIVVGSPPAPRTSDTLLYIKLDNAYDDISSTAARQALANGQSLAGLVSDPVRRFLSRT